jgi:hypothetical protein
MARMLYKADTRRGLAGHPGAQRRCSCGECDFGRNKHQQRRYEKQQTMLLVMAETAPAESVCPCWCHATPTRCHMCSNDWADLCDSAYTV